MPKSSLVLDKRRVLNDGTYPIKIKVGYGTNIYLSTGIYLKPDDWDKRTQMCTGRLCKRINDILGQLLQQVTARVIELRMSGMYDTLTRAQLRQMLTDMSLNAPTVGVPYFGDYMDKVAAVKSGKTQESYHSTKRRLSAYCDIYALRFADMSYLWFEGFINCLKADGLKKNTVSKYLKVIKTVIRYAADDGVQINNAYRRVDSSAEKDTPMRNLPIETMRRIRDTRIKGKTAQYKDAFMLSFYLIGINLADLLELPKDCISNGRLEYTRAKTGKNYSIKVEPEAWEIINRYKGKRHLLSFGESVHGFRENCNALLGSLEGGVTWYYARYSWANYAVDLDIPKDVISECLGHAHGSSVTGIYIRYSHDKIDKANRMVLDYLAAE